MSALDIISERKIVAIIRLPQIDNAVALCQALVDGNIRALEVTLTTDGALEAIQEVSTAFAGRTDVTIGAGSVLTVEQAQVAINAGAAFIVSPVSDPKLITFCKAAGVPVMPGAFTPTEIQTAWELGADVVKIFPARSLSSAYIRDVLAPLPHLKIMPTGGVTLETLPDYLAAGAVAVGLGSNLLDKKAIAAGDWKAISENAAQYAAAAQP